MTALPQPGTDTVHVWEVKLVSYIPTIHVVAPPEASFDSIAQAAHVAFHGRTESEYGQDVIAARGIASITRVEGDYLLHPTLGAKP